LFAAMPSPTSYRFEGVRPCLSKAGIVAQVGPGVTDVEVGDHCVLAFNSACGTCDRCSRGRAQLCRIRMKTMRIRMKDKDGKDMRQMGIGCMAEYTVVDRPSVIKVDKSIPLDKASLVGCCVTTGVGSVFNKARVEPGSTCACFGTGGVGLNVIQGCKIAGAKTIIAVDINDLKLEGAKKFGATHVVNPTKDGDPVKAIKTIVRDGVDYAFEVIGLPQTNEKACNFSCAGGTMCMVGVAGAKDTMPMPLVLNEKTFTSAIYGSSNPRRDFIKLLDLYQGGKLMLDELVTKTYKIDQVQSAFDDLFAGVNLRGVLVMGAQPKM
jgi:Zn-dependent alcohol dehydrogenase